MFVQMAKVQILVAEVETTVNNQLLTNHTGPNTNPELMTPNHFRHEKTTSIDTFSLTSAISNNENYLLESPGHQSLKGICNYLN